MAQKLDILVFGAHPDDAELGAGATIAKEIAQGKKVGIVDLTRGELGTRGSAEIRSREAARAAEILGISMRENLEFRDGFLSKRSPAPNGRYSPNTKVQAGYRALQRHS